MVATDFPAEDKFLALPERPHTRGADFSLHHRAGRLRQVLHVLRRALYARRRISRGPPPRSSPRSSGSRPRSAREITLLGQNVNAYRGEGPDGRDWSLAKLLSGSPTIAEIERLRYTTSHPRDMDDELIALHGDEPKLMPYLHLPFQSGSDRILTAMNRKHTAARLCRAGGSQFARRGPTSRSPPTLLSASRARPTPTSKTTLALVRRVGFAQRLLL